MSDRRRPYMVLLVEPDWPVVESHLIDLGIDYRVAVEVLGGMVLHVTWAGRDAEAGGESLLRLLRGRLSCDCTVAYQESPVVVVGWGPLGAGG